MKFVKICLLASTLSFLLCNPIKDDGDNGTLKARFQGAWSSQTPYTIAGYSITRYTITGDSFNYKYVNYSDVVIFGPCSPDGARYAFRAGIFTITQDSLYFVGRKTDSTYNEPTIFCYDTGNYRDSGRYLIRNDSLFYPYNESLSGTGIFVKQ